MFAIIHGFEKNYKTQLHPLFMIGLWITFAQVMVYEKSILCDIQSHNSQIFIKELSSVEYICVRLLVVNNQLFSKFIALEEEWGKIMSPNG